mmetsp:Transcript_109273/g.189609  ORF Transcript_109273/g.189609 Transcript_109273/m.189609 type:complete len:243 (-) Transcript_109273:207-935(-)
MTDRFYPLGKPSAEDVWKSSYEVQNEMRSFQRSSYPPGYAGHEPGAREKFGYSSPGPDANRLTASHLALREEMDVLEPRRIHAIPRVQVSDERQTFQNLDVPEMNRSYRSPMATMSSGGQGMPKVRSLPTLTKTMRQARLSQNAKPTTKLEDEDFAYFVPRGLQRESRDRLMSRSLSKLHKSPEKKVMLPFAGDGTGFRTSCAGCEWWPPAARLHEEPSSYMSSFQRPAFFRMSPIGPSGTR